MDDLQGDGSDNLTGGIRLTRRQAVRRLAVIGLSFTAAPAFLAACGDGGEGATQGDGPATTAVPATAVTPTTAPPTTMPVRVQDVTYPGPNGTLFGAYAAVPSPKGALIVVHDDRGLVDDVRVAARRLVGDGFSALAVDLLSEEGGTAQVPTNRVSAALNAVPQARIRSDLRAGIDELARRNPTAKIGILGIFFGGTVVWDFLTVAETRLATAASLYGTVPRNVVFRNKAPVLAIYGDTDTRSSATQDAAIAALDKAGVDYNVVTYANVNHGFYNPDESEKPEAYRTVIQWFARRLG